MCCVTVDYIVGRTLMLVKLLILYPFDNIGGKPFSKKDVMLQAASGLCRCCIQCRFSVCIPYCFWKNRGTFTDYENSRIYEVGAYEC